MGYRLSATHELAIYNYVRDQSGLDPNSIIWDRQDVYGSAMAVAPNKPYLTMSITGLKTPHGASRSWFTLDTWNMSQLKAFTTRFRIISLSDGYFETMDNLRSSLDRIDVREKFRAVNMAWWNASDVQDVMLMYSTQHVFCAYFDAEFAFTKVQQEATGQIDSVRVDYDYDSGAHTGTIIVPP